MKPALKVLHLYTAFDTEEAKYYIEAYEKETGIDVHWIRLPSDEIAARLEAESGAPQASVWYAGSNTDHISAALKGLLAPYKPKTDFELMPQFHDKSWLWSGFYTGAIGFISNKSFLEKKRIEASASWQDMLSPAFEKNEERGLPSLRLGPPG